MRKFPVYLVFALYPVLALWAQNIQEVGFEQIVRAMVVSIFISVLAFLIVWLFTRNIERSGLIAVMGLVIFFSYGHLYESVREWSFELARHRYLLPFVILLFSVWVFFIFRNKQLKGLIEFFSLFSLVIFVVPLYTIINYEARLLAGYEKQTAVIVEPQGVQNRPDIYYIIVDGYGRQDSLERYYQFDNSEFIEYLERRGFYVAKESTSNYRKTVLSLTSSLNMSYVQSLLPHLDVNSRDYTELIELIRHSAVRQFLAENGYRMVSVDNGLKMTASDAEVLLTPDNAYLSERVDLGDEGFAVNLNSFEGLFLETTLAKLWVHWQVSQGKENVLNVVSVEAPYNRHRQSILFAVNSLTTAAEMEGDNFVFIHILAPHPPFVFGPNGEQIKHDRLFTIADGPYSQGSKEDYRSGYTGQVTFINKQLMTVIDYVLENSETKPIIIIQGDHGPKGFSDKDSEDFTENFAILNAYYFPDGEYTGLYPSISPVNSFPVILNRFFGAEFPLQDDQSYYSDEKRPFDFIEVTNQIR